MKLPYLFWEGLLFNSHGEPSCFHNDVIIHIHLCVHYMVSLSTDLLHVLLLLHPELCVGAVQGSEGEVLQKAEWLPCTGRTSNLLHCVSEQQRNPSLSSAMFSGHRESLICSIIVKQNHVVFQSFFLTPPLLWPPDSVCVFVVWVSTGIPNFYNPKNALNFLT